MLLGLVFPLTLLVQDKKIDAFMVPEEEYHIIYRDTHTVLQLLWPIYSILEISFLDTMLASIVALRPFIHFVT